MRNFSQIPLAEGRLLYVLVLKQERFQHLQEIQACALSVNQEIKGRDVSVGRRCPSYFSDLCCVRQFHPELHSRSLENKAFLAGFEHAMDMGKVSDSGKERRLFHDHLSHL
jgi:hypothetical protein